MKPMLSRRKSDSSPLLISVMSFSFSHILPDVAASRPEITLRNVVLPEPEGPTSAVNSPRLMVRSRYSFVTPSVTMTRSLTTSLITAS